MIRLCEYKQPNAAGVYGGDMLHEEFERAALYCATNSWHTEGVRDAGWDGYIVVQTNNDRMSGWIKTYYYRNHPTRSYMALYKINRAGGYLEAL